MMDHAYVVADQFGNPIAVCIDESVAEEFRLFGITKVMRRPLVSSHSALEDLGKSRETPLKRKPPKREAEKYMELVKPANEAQSRILEK